MFVNPAKAGHVLKRSAIQSVKRERLWIPASAGMTTKTP